MLVEVIPTCQRLETPDSLVYFFGATDPLQHEALFLRRAGLLASVVRATMGPGGLVLDVPEWSLERDKTLGRLAALFGVQLVVLLGDGMDRAVGKVREWPVDARVVRLPKPGGVAARTPAPCMLDGYMRRITHLSTHHHEASVLVASLRIYRLGGVGRVRARHAAGEAPPVADPDSAVQVGAEDAFELERAVLAVTSATTVAQLKEAAVLLLAVVVDVMEDGRMCTVRFLAPPRSEHHDYLVERLLLVGTLRASASTVERAGMRAGG